MTAFKEVPPESRVGAVFYQGAFRKNWITACIKCKLGRWEYLDSKLKQRKYVALSFMTCAVQPFANMTLAGVQQNVIMAISGHKTISVFLRYNIVAPKQLQTAMQAVELHQRTELQGQPEERKQLQLESHGQKQVQGKETKQLTAGKEKSKQHRSFANNTSADANR